MCVFFCLFLYLLILELMRKKPNDFVLGVRRWVSLSTISGMDDVLYLVHVPVSTSFRRAHIGDGAAAPF